MSDIKFDISILDRTVIAPEERKSYFKNLIDNFNLFIPTLKILYAGMNYNKDIKADFIIICKGQINKIDYYFWTCPFIFTDKSLPGYRYAVQNNKHREYFELMNNTMAKTNTKYFMEYIVSDYCGELSLNPNNDKYWLNPKNIDILISGLIDLELLYKPAGYIPKNRPQSSKAQ